MAVVSDLYILQLDRIREKLRNILMDKGIIKDKDATLEELVEAVKETDIKDSFVGYLNGITPSYINTNDIIVLRTGQFQDSTTLEKIKIPNAVTLQAQCFQNCSNLKNVYSPNCVNIYNNVFANTAVENIILPNVQYVGSNSCPFTSKKLKRLIAQNLNTLGTVDTLSAELMDVGSPCLSAVDTYLPLLKIFVIRKSGVKNIVSSRIFQNLEEAYVPQAMVEKYKTATNWSVYADKIKPIEGSKYEDLDWYKNEQWYAEEMSVWE